MNTDPVIVIPTMMKNSGDCGIVCLKMLLGVHYDAVMAACPKRGKPQHNGLTARQMINVARRLGFALEYHTEPEDDAVGILDLDHELGVGHYVVYGKGTVYNPAQHEWWMDVEAFLRRGSEGKPWIVAGILQRR